MLTRTIWVSCSTFAKASADAVVTLFAPAEAGFGPAERDFASPSSASLRFLTSCVNFAELRFAPVRLRHPDSYREADPQLLLLLLGQLLFTAAPGLLTSAHNISDIVRLSPPRRINKVLSCQLNSGLLSGPALALDNWPVRRYHKHLL